jgi:hypothetical protein
LKQKIDAYTIEPKITQAYILKQNINKTNCHKDNKGSKYGEIANKISTVLHQKPPKLMINRQRDAYYTDRVCCNTIMHE